MSDQRRFVAIERQVHNGPYGYESAEPAWVNPEFVVAVKPLFHDGRIPDSPVKSSVYLAGGATFESPLTAVEILNLLIAEHE